MPPCQWLIALSPKLTGSATANPASRVEGGRAWLARLELPTVARRTVDLALRPIDFLDAELDQLDATLAHIARGQPGLRASEALLVASA